MQIGSGPISPNQGQVLCPSSAGAWAEPSTRCQERAGEGSPPAGGRRPGRDAASGRGARPRKLEGRVLCRLWPAANSPSCGLGPHPSAHPHWALRRPRTVSRTPRAGHQGRWTQPVAGRPGELRDVGARPPPAAPAPGPPRYQHKAGPTALRPGHSVPSSRDGGSRRGPRSGLGSCRGRRAGGVSVGGRPAQVPSSACSPYQSDGLPGRAGATPRVLLNSRGREPQRSAGNRREAGRSSSERRADWAAEAGREWGWGAGRLGGTGKEERSRPLQVPSARRAASAPQGGKAVFPYPIVALLSIRSRFLPRPEAPEGMGSEPWATWARPFSRHQRDLNFQQTWKVTFTCV